MPKGKYERKKTPLAERFWPKVQKAAPDECWLFTGSLNEHGYGQIFHNGRLIKAHKAAYILTHGDVEAEAFLHKCDNPPCCNPAHIRPGTMSENTQDMIAKGRHKTPFGSEVKGEGHPSSKLTDAQRLAIRQDPRSHRVIAKDYEIGKSQVTRLKKADTAGGNW